MLVMGLLTVIILASSIAGYLNWSSNAAWDDFLERGATSEASAVMDSEGRTGCPRGNRQLPSQLSADTE
jgi:hypothetical protein